MLECQICHKLFKHLGSHLYNKHKILSRDYKMRLGLNINTPLVIKEITIKQKRNAATKPTYKQNFLDSKKYQFKPGKRIKRQYISPVKYRQNYEEILKTNSSRKPELCPVCNIEFNNLPTHLYMKHKLIRT